MFVLLLPSVDRSLKRRQVKPLAASLLDALDYDSSDDSDFEVGDSSGEWRNLIPPRKTYPWGSGSDPPFRNVSLRSLEYYAKEYFPDNSSPLGNIVVTFSVSAVGQTCAMACSRKVEDAEVTGGAAAEV